MEHFNNENQTMHTTPDKNSHFNLSELPENITFKTKSILIIIGIYLLITITACLTTYNTGFNNMTKKATQERFKQIEQQTSEASKKLLDIKNQITENQADLDALLKYQSDKDTYTKEIENLKGDITTLETDIKQKTNEISTKTVELEKLNNGIIKASSQAKVLPAGAFTVGTDIQPGRYSVTGKSNFVVYSSSGKLKVNTILGGGDWGVEEYICNLTTGDLIKAESKCTYTPVQ